MHGCALCALLFGSAGILALTNVHMPTNGQHASVYRGMLRDISLYAPGPSNAFGFSLGDWNFTYEDECRHYLGSNTRAPGDRGRATIFQQDAAHLTECCQPDDTRREALGDDISRTSRLDRFVLCRLRRPRLLTSTSPPLCSVPSPTMPLLAITSRLAHALLRLLLDLVFRLIRSRSGLRNIPRLLNSSMLFVNLVVGVHILAPNIRE